MVHTAMSMLTFGIVGINLVSLALLGEGCLCCGFRKAGGFINLFWVELILLAALLLWFSMVCVGFQKL